MASFVVIEPVRGKHVVLESNTVTVRHIRQNEETFEVTNPVEPKQFSSTW